MMKAVGSRVEGEEEEEEGVFPNIDSQDRKKGN